MQPNIFDYITHWNVGDIEDTNHKKLKRRSVEGRSFQFKKLDVRARTRMLIKLRALIEIADPMIRAGISLFQGTDPEAAADAKPEDFDLGKLVQDFLPQLIERVFDESLVDMFDDLASQAMVEIDGKFVALTNPNAYESAFDEDITLQVPVALTVLEVNLADSFFKILNRYLPQGLPTSDS